MAGARTGGRTDKREAIIRAALEVLAEGGYATASMEAIAARAQVAKPTIYNHFDDKSALLAATVEHYSTHTNAQMREAVSALDVHADDLRDELSRAGRLLLGCLSSPTGRAVMRVELVESGRLNELSAQLRERGTERTFDTLAGKFAQLSLAGRLRALDSDRAARQFFALITDQPLRVSAFGTREVPTEVIDRAITEGVDTFLAAFGVAGSDTSSTTGAAPVAQ